MAFVNCPRCQQLTSDRSDACRGCARRGVDGSMTPPPAASAGHHPGLAGRLGLLLGLGLLVPVAFLGWSHLHRGPAGTPAPGNASPAAQLAKARPVVRRG